LIVAAVLGAIATAYFGTIRRRQDEAETGIRALAAMRWREFSHFVLDAMRHRGYDVLTADDEAERGQQTEFLLGRNGERALLSCKHGSAYKLTRQSVAELVAAMKFQGARSGLLVTTGTIDPDARKAAEAADIELIDGRALWPEISPLLPQSLNDDVRREAGHRAHRQLTIGWTGAVVAGLAVGLLVGGIRSTPDPEAQDMSVLYAKKPAKPAPMVAAPAAPVSIKAPIGISAPSTEIVAATPEDEEAQRANAVRLISTLPGIERVVWSTKSTLLVYVDESSTERFDEICSVLTQYANLRTARVHLQPPENSQQMVRFKQCQNY
jgi:hypothetical protein